MHLSRAFVPMLALLLGLSLWRVPAAAASHLAVELTVEGRPQPAHAVMDTTPPPGGTHPRPLVHVRANDPVKLHWSMKNTDRKKLDRLLVHLLIVREAQAGQKEVPDRKDAVWETISATALDPGKETHGDVEVPVGEPGTYLVRVESMFTERDHEHFAAVDLQVE